MNIHSNARTCPKSRAELVHRVRNAAWSAGQAAQAAAVSVRTTYKWLRRHDREGESGLSDRSSRPNRRPRETPTERADLIVLLRHCRMSGPEIAQALEMPSSTVAAVLQRAGLSRLRDLAPRGRPVRYERSHPGELVHIDVKKLGRIKRIGHRITGNRRDTIRGAGWEYVHVCIDDASRLAYVEVLEDEKGITAVAFLRRAIAFYRRHGVRVRSVMTDNGSPYVSKLFARQCQLARLQHLRTRPYRPATNGKAERFIRTMLEEWAYAIPYRHSRERNAALKLWLDYYNRFRPHGSLGRLPPISRLGPAVNNLSGKYS